jgi:flagellar biosynthesis GTPase FlhF
VVRAQVELRSPYKKGRKIFITKNDYFEDGQPIYRVERMVCETRKNFNDGSHIIYVNGSYKGDDAIGKLVHDFRCSNADDMYYSQLADGVRYYKEKEGGREKVCEAVERYAEKKAEERARTVEEYAEKRAAERVREAEAKAEERTAERVREAEAKAEEKQAVMVKNLMNNMNLTINQAFDVLNVSETDRKAIADLI